MAYDDYKKPYGYEAKPQQSKPRKKKAVNPPKKVVEPPKPKVVELPIATRNFRIGDKELVKGEPVTGLSENTVKSLKKRGLVK